MRRRRRDAAAGLETLGSTYYKKNWEPMWQKHTTWTNNSPGIAQEPYNLREVCFDEVHKGPPYTDGGPFEKWSAEPRFSSPHCPGVYKGQLGDTMWEYRGSFCCSAVPESTWWGTAGKWSDQPAIITAPFTATWGDYSSYGAKAWKKYQPGKSIADMGVFIGELSDVPRMLKTTARWFNREYLSRFGRDPRGKKKVLADNWLNIQFGWIPFIADLRKMYRAYVTMDKWYKQLVRDNGQWVKREGTMLQDSREEVLLDIANGHHFYPNLGSYYYPAYPTRGTSKILRITEERCWFEARFRYYCPDIGSVGFKKRAIQHLFGLEISPVLVWELIPWSWLIDWFTNIGDLISNYSSTSLFANLAAKYAYLMGEKRVLVRCESTCKLSPPVQATWDCLLVRKSRKEANPFGFDLSWGDLSSRQWSILSALGISRMH